MIFHRGLIKFSTVISVLFFVAACGGSNSSNVAIPNVSQNPSVAELFQPVIKDSWFLGGRQYTARVSHQLFGSETVLIRSTDFGMNDQLGEGKYDPFSGSSLSITLTKSGEGVYPLTDLDGVCNAVENGVAAASINLIVGVGIIQTTAIEDPITFMEWGPTQTAGMATVTLDDDGFYYVSISEPVIFDKLIDRSASVGIAVPGPDQLAFTTTRIERTSDSSWPLGCGETPSTTMLP